MTEAEEIELDEGIKYKGGGNLDNFIKIHRGAQVEYRHTFYEDPDVSERSAKPALANFAWEVMLRLKREPENSKVRMKFETEWSSLNRKYGDPRSERMGFRMGPVEARSRYELLDETADQLNLRGITKIGEKGDIVEIVIAPEAAVMFLARIIHEEMGNEGSMVVLFEAPMGAGKSISAASFSFFVDPPLYRFENDESGNPKRIDSRIGFTVAGRTSFEPADYYRITGVESTLIPPGSVVFLDDWSVGGGNSRDFYKDGNKDFNAAVQISREEGHILVGTTVDVGEIDRGLRKHIKMVFKSDRNEERKGYFKVGRPKWENDSSRKYTLEPFMIHSTGLQGKNDKGEGRETEVNLVIDSCYVPILDHDEALKYKNLKAAFRRKIKKRAADRNSMVEKINEAKLQQEYARAVQRKAMKCPKCKQPVTILNNGKRQQCPSCGKTITVQQIANA